MPLYLRESEVAELLSPEDAVEAVEGCFRRMAAGRVELRPRFRLGLNPGLLNVMAASDLDLGVAGLKSYAVSDGGARFVVVLFAADRAEVLALIEADTLGQLRTGAASAVAARHLAKPGAKSLGVIGTGWQAESQVRCMRAALPDLERVVAYSRNEEALARFCERFDAEPGEYNKNAAEMDVVVTITSSKDPVLRGEWLKPGALVCAVGANRIQSRELDNAVVERAAFVCCDSKEQAKIEAGDLVEPVERGVLDWLEVHELSEVVGGEVPERVQEQAVVVRPTVVEGLLFGSRGGHAYSCHRTVDRRYMPDRPFSSASVGPPNVNSPALSVSSRTSDETRISDPRASAAMRAARFTALP